MTSPKTDRKGAMSLFIQDEKEDIAELDEIISYLKRGEDSG